MFKRINKSIIIVLVFSMILSSFVLTPVMADTNEENISIDMREADIRDVLSAIAVNMDKNIIYTGEPMTVNFTIQDVKAKTALIYLLNTFGLDYIEDSETLIIGLRDTLNKEFYNKISLSKFVLNYVTSDIISTQIDALGIPVKKVTLDTNKKVIWIQGLPQELSKVHELIAMLDRYENAAPQATAASALVLTPLTMKYINADQMNNVIAQMGMNAGIVLASNPMTLWVYGDSKSTAQVQEIQKKVDIAANSNSENITLTSVKMQFLTTDEIIPILTELNVDATIIVFDRSLQTLWLNGTDEAIAFATNIIKKFDIKENMNDNIFFVYKTVNITAQELKSRFDNLQLENIEINYLNYPEFSKSVIVHCPSDYKLYVMNHITKFDVLTEKIKVPVDYSDVLAGVTRLTERRNLLVSLTGIPVTSFTISNNVSRNDEFLFIMYLEETAENIKLVKDYVKYIDEAITDGLSD